MKISAFQIIQQASTNLDQFFLLFKLLQQVRVLSEHCKFHYLLLLVSNFTCKMGLKWMVAFFLLDMLYWWVWFTCSSTEWLWYPFEDKENNFLIFMSGYFQELFDAKVIKSLTFRGNLKHIFWNMLSRVWTKIEHNWFVWIWFNYFRW